MPPTGTAVDEVAGALQLSLGLLVRRIRQLPTGSDLTLPESAALARLDRRGPSTSSDLAKVEQISPQSMGVTLGKLLSRGLIGRQADPEDGRRVVLFLTPSGREVLSDRRTRRTGRLAEVLEAEFSADELDRLQAIMPLLERLAHRI